MPLFNEGIKTDCKRAAAGQAVCWCWVWDWAHQDAWWKYLKSWCLNMLLKPWEQSLPTYSKPGTLASGVVGFCSVEPWIKTLILQACGFTVRHKETQWSTYYEELQVYSKCVAPSCWITGQVLKNSQEAIPDVLDEEWIWASLDPLTLIPNSSPNPAKLGFRGSRRMWDEIQVKWIQEMIPDGVWRKQQRRWSTGLFIRLHRMGLSHSKMRQVIFLAAVQLLIIHFYLFFIL